MADSNPCDKDMRIAKLERIVEKNNRHRIYDKRVLELAHEVINDDIQCRRENEALRAKLDRVTRENGALRFNIDRVTRERNIIANVVETLVDELSDARKELIELKEMYLAAECIFNLS